MAPETFLWKIACIDVIGGSASAVSFLLCFVAFEGMEIRRISCWKLSRRLEQCRSRLEGDAILIQVLFWLGLLHLPFSVVARLYIVVESFISLRYVPIGDYLRDGTMDELYTSFLDFPTRFGLASFGRKVISRDVFLESNVSSFQQILVRVSCAECLTFLGVGARYFRYIGELLNTQGNYCFIRIRVSRRQSPVQATAPDFVRMLTSYIGALNTQHTLRLHIPCSSPHSSRPNNPHRSLQRESKPASPSPPPRPARWLELWYSGKSV